MMKADKSWFWKIPAVVGVLGSLGYFGFDLMRYRPALAYEVEEGLDSVRAQIEVISKIVYQRECKEINHDWFDVMKLKTEYERNGEELPDWLIREIIRLQAEKAEFNCP